MYAVPLKYTHLLHHTKISYFMQYVSNNLFHWCALWLRLYTYVFLFSFYPFLGLACKIYQLPLIIWKLMPSCIATRSIVHIVKHVVYYTYWLHTYHKTPWNDREIWKSEKCVEYVWSISQSTFFAFHVSHFNQGGGFLIKHLRFLIEFCVNQHWYTVQNQNFMIMAKVWKGMFLISPFFS